MYARTPAILLLRIFLSLLPSLPLSPSLPPSLSLFPSLSLSLPPSLSLSLSLSQLLEAITLTEIFRENSTLCSKVQESEVHYFIRAIEKKRDIRYLKFLQTIMKVDRKPVKRAQDLVMAEVKECY